MSDLNALAEKLAALTSQEGLDDTGARLISEGGTPAPLTAILRAVDDTILERCLEFRSENASVRIIAAGRRLRGIEVVSPQRESEIMGQVLSREEPDGIAAARDLLQDILGTAQKLTVRSLPAVPFGKGGDRGISASGLSDLWETTMEVVALPPMERFLAVNNQAILALLHVRKGKIITKEGDFKALQKIWSNQVDAFREAHKKTLRAEEGAQLVCLDGAFEDGNSAAMALFEDDVTLIAYAGEHFGALQASWQRIFG